MVSGVGGRESGGNSWCLHQAISIMLLFRVWGVAGGRGIGCVSRVPANSHVVGIGFSGTFNTMQDVG